MKKRNKTVTVRKCVLEDDPAEIALCIYLTDPFIYPGICDSPFNKQWIDYIAASLRNKNNIFCADNLYVAEMDGSIAGVCCFLECDHFYLSADPDLPLCKTSCFIHVKKGYFDSLVEENLSFTGINLINLCVLPEYRGMHIGFDLLSKLIEEHGEGDIHLDVLAGNESAIKLYEKCGFVKTNTFLGFGCGTDVECYHMVRSTSQM